jgi:hypothetical protein
MTDEAADSLVEYGANASYGSSSTPDSSLVTSHSVSLSGLSAGTLYHFRVDSGNADGQISDSGDNTFTTAAVFSGGGGGGSYSGGGAVQISPISTSTPTSTTTPALFSSSTPALGLLMADTLSLPFSSGSLVNDRGTIYYISKDVKIPFTSMKAFLGLGYSLKHVVLGDTGAYTRAASFLLSSPTQEHPWNSFLNYGRTIYYFDQQGFIPVPSMAIFLSNGGDLTKVVPLSKTEKSIIKTMLLPIMQFKDPRVER